MNSEINPKNYVAHGTSLHSFVAWTLLWVLGPIIVAAIIVMTWGIGLLGGLMAAAFYSSRARKARALLRGSAVRVDAKQFPEIHTTVQDIAARVGLSECPDVYIVEDNRQNAFALRHGAKRSIVLVDDLVHGALCTSNPKVLQFIIAHELAHHALGHTNLLRSFITSKYLPLSRLDEFSCDAVAHAVVNDTAAARDALALLLIGPQLFQRIDREALDAQAHEVMADRFSKKSEATLSHPLLLHRYAKLQEPIAA